MGQNSEQFQVRIRILSIISPKRCIQLKKKRSNYLNLNYNAFLQQQKKQEIMGKRKIDALDSVQSTGDWQFVNEKKQRIKVKSQKQVNCEFYLTFSDVTPLYTFLYLSLAPEQALGFQKVQPLLQKMKGEDEDSKRDFEECRKTLNLNWDGSVPLPEAMRKIKQDIIKQQNRILQIASRITEDEGKQLLKSGLSQRKIHLDFHTNDGSAEQFIIPTIQNINDCVTIIHDTERNKYLIAFMSHVQAPVAETDQNKQINKPEQSHNVAQTFKDRPIHQKVSNPDDRPLPTPKQNSILRNINSSAKNIQNPDDRLLPTLSYSEPNSKPMPTIPRQILNPDQKLLPPPTKENKESQRRKSSGAENDLKKDMRIVGQKIEGKVHTLGENIEQKAHNFGEKAMQLGRKVEDKVEEVVEDVKNNKGQWVSIAIAGAIVVAAIKVLRA